jgi:hypothetical protein
VKTKPFAGLNLSSEIFVSKIIDSLLKLHAVYFKDDKDLPLPPIHQAKL